jgi:hypothetical protein
VKRARCDNERGASLVLAIVFMVVIGGIMGGTFTLVTSGVNNRSSLDAARNREYAADAGIEYAITQVRALPAPGPGFTGCVAGTHYTPPTTIDSVASRVNCTNVPTTTFSRFQQQNVIFRACVENGADCTDANSIIRAQINFEAVRSDALVSVTRTWVQSWSVNR